MDYQLRRGRRRTLSIRIVKNSVIVCAPLNLPEGVIRSFVESKRAWIENQLSAGKALPPDWTKAQLQELTLQAKQDIPARVARYAPALGVSYGRITIRHQKTRWGSCSSKKNLNFNCLLMLTPERVRDYVVVHELCHLLEMNHSSRFWSLVEKAMPDYKESRNWLRTRGKTLIDRL